MRKLGTAVLALGLMVLGLAAPATAQADDIGTAGAVCNSKWPGRDGYVRAWSGYDCGGTYLGRASGNDANWNNYAGGFQYPDANSASSVMNSGYVGAYDVVAFYYYTSYDGGYGCLSPHELYVDDLRRNTFTSGYNMNNNIMSHRWVNSTSCRTGSWMQ